MRFIGMGRVVMVMRSMISIPGMIMIVCRGVCTMLMFMFVLVQVFMVVLMSMWMAVHRVAMCMFMFMGVCMVM